MAHRFSLEAIAGLGSDHLPLLFFLDKDIKVERFNARNAPTTPKQIGLSSTNASMTACMICYQLGPCQNVWRHSVISQNVPSQRQSPSRRSAK